MNRLAAAHLCAKVDHALKSYMYLALELLVAIET